MFGSYSFSEVFFALWCISGLTVLFIWFIYWVINKVHKNHIEHIAEVEMFKQLINDVETMRKNQECISRLRRENEKLMKQLREREVDNNACY